jgi:Lrp/AsnC family leucine-responsive transcriptional regulator
LINRYEEEILDLLQKDGRISNVELAKKIGLSESPCLRKTKALEETGVITGYQAVVDAKKVGCNISAILMVNLYQSVGKINDFFDKVQKEKRVIECLALTGTSDIMLKVVAKDIEDLTELTFNGLLVDPSVKDVSSCVVLKEIKKSGAVPVLT